MRWRSMLPMLLMGLAGTAAGCHAPPRPAPAGAPVPQAAGCPGAAGGDSVGAPCVRAGRGHGAMGGMEHGRMGRGMGGMHGRMHGDGAAPAPAASGSTARACPAATPALADAGRAVYARGSCAACHGTEGRGTPMGPDLTDGAWLHGDGSYGSIADVVAAGVARPVRHPGVMPPRGGADLAPADVCAVAAYVHALSSGAGREHGR